jgi:hypothetical protein
MSKEKLKEIDLVFKPQVKSSGVLMGSKDDYSKPSQEDEDRAFQIRCASKEGKYVSIEDLSWVSKLQMQHKKWASELSKKVFRCTAPFGARVFND